MVHSEMVAPYILAWGSEALKREWLPRMVLGEAIGALGMTEPGAGSDAKNIRTPAIRDGSEYVINGQTPYISNGQHADIIVHACNTDPDPRPTAVSTPNSVVQGKSVPVRVTPGRPLTITQHTTHQIPTQQT